jgi:methionyl-tRNA synthetase
MIEKYIQGEPPRGPGRTTYDDQVKALDAVLERSLEGFDFGGALDAIWAVINKANKSIEETKPWVLVRENRTAELHEFLAGLIEVLRVVARSLRPFMPSTARSIEQQFAQASISKGSPLFPRIETK